jgi:hypothetical protein
MKRTHLIHLTIILLLVVGLIPAHQPAAAQPAAQEVNLDAPFVPGEVVVSFAPGMTTRTVRARATALANNVGAAVVQQYSNLALLSFAPEGDVAAVVAQAAATPGVALAQPNYIYALPEAASDLLSEPAITSAYTIQTAKGQTISFSWKTLAAMRTRVKVNGTFKVVPAYPNEVTTGFHWGWNQVKADIVWRNTAAHAVCLLDTGVDIRHPDLSGRFVAGFDFVNNDSIANDDNGHGTHVAGIITAKVNNTKDTAVGASQAKIIPVKVLNAQGMGTSYSVAAGIQYCTSRSEPRVLNLSLGSYVPSRLEYEALGRFIARGRIVVAAAGNSSSSELFFPAAWADPKVKWNAGYTKAVYDSNDPAAPANILHHSLVSVASGRPPGETKVWVDQNGNGSIQENELFAPEMCASGLALDAGAVGSNYGAWVNLVAPGDGIYSTTPVSYPFYMNYYYQTASGYEFMSGTSMAAGFVSAAAARAARLNITVKGVTRNLNGQEIKAKLIESGSPLQLAVDPLVPDPTKGYDNITNKISMPRYGEKYYTPDAVILAPYCWPKVSGPFGAMQDMSQARYLDIASAINRMAMMAEVKDAENGLPVPGAIVRMVNSSGVEQGNAVTIVDTSYVVVLNLSANSIYSQRITKTGYVSGTQIFNTGVSGHDKAGQVVFDAYATVSLPRATGMHFVLDWRDPYIKPGVSSDPTVDLDMYLGVPTSSVTTGGGTIQVSALIGPMNPDKEFARDASKFNGTIEDFTFVNKAPYLGKAYRIGDTGTLLAPAAFMGIYSPFAIHNFDGGLETPQDPEGLVISPFESISMMWGSTRTTAPFYLPKYKGDYLVYITDPNSSETEDSTLKLRDRSDPLFTAPILRYWSKGTIQRIVTMPATCNGKATWWAPMKVNNTTISSADNACSNAMP